MTEIEEKKYAFDAAVAFSDRYPFTRFMSGKHIDYESALLRRGVNVNVYLIGFGKINQAVFLTSTEVNQFLTAEEGAVLYFRQSGYKKEKDFFGHILSV